MTASVIGFVMVLVLSLLRVPIAFAMGIVGFVGFGLEIGWSPSFALVAQVTYDTGLDYGLSVVPLFVKMGVTPELASSHFLVQRTGLGKASEMCLTGRLYSGREAFEIGLADRLVAAAELMSEATGLAREIAANPAPHLRWVKELLTENGAESDMALVQQREMEALAKAYVSAEHKEAVDAFLEKRPPDFKRASGS